MADLMHKKEIQALVGDAYRGIAGPSAAGQSLYSAEQLASVPKGARDWSLGVGNPVAAADLRPGEVVLDLGSGGGIDTVLAARAVGPGGFAVGLDLLPEMALRADAHAKEAAADALFVAAEMESIPLAESSVDVIVSNGVVNLSARKARVLAECFRVLRPGGRMCLTDLTMDEEDLPVEVLVHPAAWAG